MVDVQEAMEELILPVLEGYMGNPARRTSIQGASQHIVYVSARSSINRTILQPLASKVQALVKHQKHSVMR